MDSHVFQQKRKQYRVLNRQYLRLMKRSEKAITDGLPMTAKSYFDIAQQILLQLDALQVELDIEKFTGDTN